MKKQLLNGKWNYRIGKGEWGEVEVPFSALPVGHSECSVRFDLADKSERIVLLFEGITYSATVMLNGTLLGKMGPYCEYKFDVTDVVKEKDNDLAVEIEDISPEFGPSMGWGNYGGLVRDVSILYLGKSNIDDVFFRCTLTHDYKDACYTADFTLGGDGKGEVTVTLKKGDKVVDEYRVKEGEKSPSRTVKSVSLWSPENPNLYDLTVLLVRDGEVIDEYEHKVGFREFKCSRHRFMLNGEDVFLQGVCRHETILDYGHTVPYEEVEKDLLEIKKTGCNYVRLVHYPHNKQTLEILDRIGLMTSEEPGLWWSDTSNPEVSEGSLEVLRRTIKRDRNHASIVFWLCFNECYFTEQFLIDSAVTCKACDPTRLVSGANCMSIEETLVYYDKCGFDFYTMHPYSNTYERAETSIKTLTSKPLLFTEWGGCDTYDNVNLISDWIKRHYSFYLNGDDNGALAGARYWYWREVTDYDRGLPCVDGVLKEALVYADGRKTLIYDAFCSAWKEAKNPKSYGDIYEYTPLSNVDGKKSAFACDSVTDEAQLVDFVNTEMIYKMEYMRRRNATKGPILYKEEVKDISLVPKVVSDGKEISFYGNKKSKSVTVLGATSLLKGYPILGKYGEGGVTVTVESADGEREKFILCNGIDFTTAFTTYSSSKINPICENAKKFALFSYDKNFENYLINELSLPLNNEKTVTKITFSSENNGYAFLIYAVLV